MHHQVLANFMQCDCDVSIIVYEYCLSQAGDRGITVEDVAPCLGVQGVLGLDRTLVWHTLRICCMRTAAHRPSSLGPGESIGLT